MPATQMTTAPPPRPATTDAPTTHRLWHLSPHTARQDWMILRALSIYRLILAALLLALQAGGFTPNFFSHINPTLFRDTCAVYVLAAALLLAGTFAMRPRQPLQTHLHFACDALAITLLVLACHGIESGMGVLLITPVVGCSLILPTRVALFNAAVATLLIIAEETLARPGGAGLGGSESTAAGVLGLMFFATAIAGSAMARRARHSEAIAVTARHEVTDLLQLNKHIVETMQTGVLTAEANGYVQLCNAAACQLLHIDDPTGRVLPEAAPHLASALDTWRRSAQLAEEVDGVLPRFTALEDGPRTAARTLILLDDASQLRQRAQQLKLASLGHLTASVAHEIRNPLSAIGHAGQLLAEGCTANREERTLVAVIERQTARINKIVTDILSLSRSAAPTVQAIELQPWLQHCVRIYAEMHATELRPINLADVAPSLIVSFDDQHLQRLLLNLWDNSFEHGSKDGRRTIVSLEAGTLDSGQVWLDVVDNGPGIPANLVERVFEPFFTTARSGTGLGLYIARELCEYNRARLQYRTRDGHACFRILFSANEFSASGTHQDS
ncbi:MAG TPA: ATP-binding protein [Nevskiaceae bacterium]|nr:ATP-binding protein [Nevskiaceae bacterium]